MISVPFSPKFLLAFAGQRVPDFRYHEEQTMTRESIQKFFSRENPQFQPIQGDLLRLQWKYGQQGETNSGFVGCKLIAMPPRSNKMPRFEDFADLPLRSLDPGNNVVPAYVRSGDQLFYINTVDKTVAEIKVGQEQLNQFDNELRPINTFRELSKTELERISDITGHVRRAADFLSQDEIQKVSAIALSTTSSNSEQEWLQGGFLNVDYLMHQQWLVLNNVILAQPASELVVTRNPPSTDLSVTHKLHYTSIGYDAVKELNSADNNPLILTSNEFLIQEDDDQDRKIHAQMGTNYKFEINNKIWDDLIIPAAISRLDDMTPLQEQDLFKIIPCLCDPKCIKAYAERLAKGEENSSIIDRSNELINLCFEHRPNDIEKIAFTVHSVQDSLTKTVDLLKTECAKHEEYLSRFQDETRVTQHAVLKELNSCFQTESQLHPYKTLSRFAEIFANNQYVLKKNADSQGIRFLKTIGNIIAGILILPAAFLAIYKGTPKFWQSQEKIFFEDIKKSNPIHTKQLRFNLSKQELADRIKNAGPYLAILNENGFFEGGARDIQQIKFDFVDRNWLFNGKPFLGQKINDKDLPISEAQIKEYVTALFPASVDRENNVENFIAGYSSAVASPVIDILREATTFSDSQSVRIASGDTKRDGFSVNIIAKENNVYAQARYERIALQDTDGIIIGYLKGPFEANYKLSQKESNWGFELINFQTDNKAISEMLLGKKFNQNKLIQAMTPTYPLQNLKDNVEYFIERLSNQENKQTMRNFLAILEEKVSPPDKFRKFSDALTKEQEILAQNGETIPTDMVIAISKLSNIKLPMPKFRNKPPKNHAENTSMSGPNSPASESDLPEATPNSLTHIQVDSIINAEDVTQQSSKFQLPTLTREALEGEKIKKFNDIAPPEILMTLLGISDAPSPSSPEISIDLANFKPAKNGMSITTAIDPLSGGINVTYYWDRLPLKNHEGNPIGYLEGPTEFNFKLKGNPEIGAKKEYELIDVKTSNEVIYDLCQGKLVDQNQLMRAMTPLHPLRNLQLAWKNYRDFLVTNLELEDKSKSNFQSIRSRLPVKKLRPSLTPIQEKLRALDNLTSSIFHANASDHDKFEKFSTIFKDQINLFLKGAGEEESKLINIISDLSTQRWKILDFSVAPSKDLVQTSNGALDNATLNASRLLNEVHPTPENFTTVDHSFDVLFKILFNLDNTEKVMILDLLQTQSNKTAYEPIFTIDEHRNFTLSDNFKGLPTEVIPSLATFVKKICELSFSAIFKENGEYQTDFNQYVTNYFDPDSLAKIAKRIGLDATRHQLVGSAAMSLLSSEHITAQIVSDMNAQAVTVDNLLFGEGIGPILGPIITQLNANISQALIPAYLTTQFKPSSIVDLAPPNHQGSNEELSDIKDLSKLESTFNQFQNAYLALVTNLSNRDGIQIPHTDAPPIDFQNINSETLETIANYRRTIENELSEAIGYELDVALELPLTKGGESAGDYEIRALRETVAYMIDINDATLANKPSSSDAPNVPEPIITTTMSALEPAPIAPENVNTTAHSITPHPPLTPRVEPHPEISSALESKIQKPTIRYQIIEHKENDYASKLQEALRGMKISATNIESAGNLNAGQPITSDIIDATHSRIGNIDGGAVIVERLEKNQIRSELVVLPNELSPARIWEQNIKKADLKSGEKLSDDFLNNMFADISKEVKSRGRDITEKDIQKYLQNRGAPHPNNNATILFKAYNDAYQKAIYNNSKDKFPSNDLIKIAIQQVESRRQLDKTPIVIKEAFSPAYAEAISLYCHAKGYEVHKSHLFVSLFDSKVPQRRIDQMTRLLNEKADELGYDNVSSQPTLHKLN
jgi:hypothetical protein